MGKTTYDQVLTFGEYPYKDKKSYVFTRNKNSAKDENVEFVSDMAEFVKGTLPSLEGNIWLVGGGQIRFPTAAMVRVDFELGGWDQINYGEGTLIWLLQPRFFM